MNERTLRWLQGAASLVLIAGMTLVVGGSGTTGGGAGGGGLPTATCPAAPAPRSDLGSPTPRAGKRSVLVQLDYYFLNQLVSRMIMSKIPPSSPFGVQIIDVRLEDPDDAPRRNLISIRFKPAVRKSDGTGWSAIDREYNLRFQLLSYLLTPDTMPDAARRAALLGGCANGSCPQNGALFALQYYGLWGGGVRDAGVPVTCQAPGYDLVDSAILTNVYNIQASSPTIPVPLDAVLSGVGSLGLGPSKLVGLDLSTAESLTIALVFDKGSPPPFTKDEGGPMAWRGNGTATMKDWGLFIEPTLVADAAGAQLRSAAAAHNATVNSFDLSFALDTINVKTDVGTSVPVCGSQSFTATAQVKPTVCKRTIGTCANYAVDADSLCGGAILWLADDILGAFHAKDNMCVSSGQQVAFPFGDDTLYATDLNVTRGGLALTGNSTMMDGTRGGPPADGQCPWH